MASSFCDIASGGTSITTPPERPKIYAVPPPGLENHPVERLRASGPGLFHQVRHQLYPHEHPPVPDLPHLPHAGDLLRVLSEDPRSVPAILSMSPCLSYILMFSTAAAAAIGFPVYVCPWNRCTPSSNPPQECIVDPFCRQRGGQREVSAGQHLPVCDDVRVAALLRVLDHGPEPSETGGDLVQDEQHTVFFCTASGSRTGTPSER